MPVVGKDAEHVLEQHGDAHIGERIAPEVDEGLVEIVDRDVHLALDTLDDGGERFRRLAGPAEAGNAGSGASRAAIALRSSLPLGK